MGNPFDQFDAKPGELPTADELLDQAPYGSAPPPGNPFDQFDAKPGQLPTDDELLDGPLTHPPGPLSGEWFDAYFTGAAGGHMLDLFGQGFRQGWGNEPAKLSDDGQEQLKRAGYPDPATLSQEINKEYHDGIIRPLAIGLGAVTGALARTGAQLGDIFIRQPLQAGVAGLSGETPPGTPEAIEGAMSASGLIATGNIVPRPRISAGLLENANRLGVIGKGEAGWEGVSERPPQPVPAELAERPTAAAAGEPNAPVPAATAGSETPTTTPLPAAVELPDIHAVAREIAPETFADYDTLSARRDTFRRWLDQLAETRASNDRVQELQGQIDDMLSRVRGAEDRLTGRQANQLGALREQLDDYLTSDTPDMARVRRDLMAVDERMRDLAPAVSDAYRAANERMPPETATQEISQNPSRTAANRAIQAPEEISAGAPVPPAPNGAQIGRSGPHGPIVDGLQGRWDDAVAWLSQARQGEATGVLAHPDVPEPIDVVWGAGDAQRGYGLVHILAKHPEIVPELPERLAAMSKVSENRDRIVLSGNHARAVVARDFNGDPKHWLLTAYETGQRAAGPIERRDSLQADTASSASLPDANIAASGQRVEGSTVRPEGLQADTSSASLPGLDIGAAAQPVQGGIADAVARRLIAAGRPPAEANAAAQIIEAHYQARAARFDGRLGTAEELFNREGPDIRGRASGGPKGEASGRTTIRDARTIITLFQKADASTFLHETGHQWLEELLRDASDDAAPQGLRDDAATVRQWLGMDRGGPTRAQHEMFARGFEAYIMEGRAPSGRLAQVFNQFRDWLRAVYARVTAARLPVIDSVRGVYDRLLATDSDYFPVIAADRAPDIDLLEPRELPKAEASTPVAEPAAGVPVRGRPETAYEPVPKEPQRLAAFLKANGGLRDEGGELRARELGKARPGLVNRNGMNLDDAALRAWEAGYIDSPDRPDIATFLEHLDRDVAGEPVYSRGDSGAAMKYREATEKNAEVDRLAQEMGIDPRDWTREQFWNLAAEHLEGKRLDDEQRSLGEALAEDYAAAERRAEEFAESRGDAWEPHETAPRTLEDLENEDRQGENPPAARPVAGGDAAAGAAGRDQGAVLERGAEGGRAAGAEPGAGTPAAARGRGTYQPRTEPPADANQRFPAGGRLIDKAGNIRLDNLSQPDDIDQAIRDAAARNSDFLPERRGTLSDGEVLDLADALGRDPAFLDGKAIGAAFNAEEVLAARKLLVQSATTVCDAMASAAEGGDKELLALAQAIARHEMIQGKVAQATAEWGRAGRSFRALIDGAPEAAQLDRFLRENTGRTLYQLQDIAKFGQHLATPRNVSKWISDTAGSNIKRGFIYYYINNLISGPFTHTRYAIANAVNAVWSPAFDTPIAAALGAAREALGLVPDTVRVSETGRVLAAGESERVRFGEVTAQLYGLMKGSADGWKAAYEAFRAGQSPPLPGEHVPSYLASGMAPPIPGVIGKVIGLPSRSVAAIHSLFKTIRYTQNINALACRRAADEGLMGRLLPTASPNLPHRRPTG